jgi:hypothetical protein
MAGDREGHSPHNLFFQQRAVGSRKMALGWFHDGTSLTEPRISVIATSPAFATAPRVYAALFVPINP